MKTRIDSVKFGEITINGKIYYSDMIVWWDGDVEYRTKSHSFDIEEFLHLIQKKPEIIVVGSGTGSNPLLKVDKKARELAKQKKIEIFSEKSERAAELFNAFVSDGKKVAAVIHTTS